MMSLELNSAKAKEINNKAIEKSRKAKLTKEQKNNKRPVGKISSAPVNRTHNSGSNFASQNRNTKQILREQLLSHLPASSCHLLVEQILQTVGELEHTLIRDHQHDFQLRMALERQTERVRDLKSCLQNEKERNQRLVQLIRGIDSESSNDEEGDSLVMHGHEFGKAGMAADNVYESISPLLMQQRYNELSISYKQCRRHLAKKDKLLTLSKCEKEELQSRFDNLSQEYRNGQKRFEDLCCRYLRLQAKKNQEIQKLRDALSFASDCVLSAQKLLDPEDVADVEHNYEPKQHSPSPASCNSSDSNISIFHSQCQEEFRKNLQLFIKALRFCEWTSLSNRSRRSTRHSDVT